MKKPFESLLCCDLSLDACGFYVPSIYIAADLNYQYVDKKVTLDNCTNLGLLINDLPDFFKTLFNIVADFKKETLLKKFDKSKKIKTVADLLINKEVNKIVRAFLENKTDQFLTICVENKVPLSLHLDHNKAFYAAAIQAQTEALEPILRFDKTDIGIEYILQLTDNQEVYSPCNHAIHLLVDAPSWIVIDKKLFRVNHINSNKLKPFLKSKAVFIPNTMVIDYFNKFIKSIVQKVTVEANGFTVKTKNKVERCSVTVINNFFKNRYELSLNFDYGGFLFESSALKQAHSLLDIISVDNITVTHFKRNIDDEMLFEQQLQLFGFEKTYDNNFYLNSTDSFAAVQYIIDNSALFKQHNFGIIDPHIDGKRVQTNTASLLATSQEKPDWFDLKMVVVCGDFQFSFSKIINHIKTKNRLFALDDGTYFLIPAEWMTQYAPLSNFARLDNDRLLLPKANYNLIQNSSFFSTTETTAELPILEISKLVKATLRPYQLEGVKWLFNHYLNNLGACLADDMGLGKTLQTLATLVAVQHDLSFKTDVTTNLESDLFSETTPKQHALKALIVLPASLLFNWYNEAKKFTPHFKIITYIGSKRTEIFNRLKNYDLVFTTYAIVSKDIALFKKMTFTYLILDESQYIKNKGSQIFKNINTINATRKISLSGTPIENSLSDLWSQMQFINPDILGSYAFFQKYFQIPIQKNADQDKIAELKQMISPFILRRTKKQVLTELPDYSETIFLTEMSTEQQKQYEQEKSNARNQLLHIDANTNKINILNALMRLRQWSNHPKMIDQNSEIESGKFADVTNYLETLVKSNQKVLIFSSFVSHLSLYKNWSDKNSYLCSYITGATPRADREMEVNRFKNNPNVTLFFLSIGTGNVGLNLQEASFVVFLDPWWNPFKEIQAISRAHRMGQQSKVEVVKFIAKNTIEEKIIELQKAKKILADDIIENNDLPVTMQENLSFLLQ